MASDAEAYERGVKIAQTSLTPNFREGVQANPWFQLGYQMGMKHGPRAAGMMSQAKSEFPTVAARLKASRPGAKDTMAVEDRFYFGKERFADDRLLKFLEAYDRNEDNNYHSENVVLLAKFVGSTADVAQAQRIVKEHRGSSGGISDKLYEERTELNRRLLSKFRSRYPQASI